MKTNLKTTITATVLLVAATAGVLAWAPWRPTGLGEGFTSGNGRIEATEIAVATKLAGRVEKILVSEGEFVKAGQPLAQMQIESLQAQRQ
jgi:HlyD family secretion protein